MEPLLQKICPNLFPEKNMAFFLEGLPNFFFPASVVLFDQTIWILLFNAFFIDFKQELSDTLIPICFKIILSNNIQDV